MLLGAISLAEADPEESVEWYLRAIELDPEYLEPYAAAAQVFLFDLGEAPRALELCEDALALESLTPLDRFDIQLLAAEAELAAGRRDEVADRLKRISAMGHLGAILEETDDEQRRLDALKELWSEDAFDEEDAAECLGKVVQLTARMSRLWLDLREPKQALPWLRAIVERASGDADAWYLLGEAEALMGNAKAASHAALQTYRIDAQLRLPKWSPRPATLHRKAVEVVTTCANADIRALLEKTENLVVLIHEAPSLELVLEGVDPRAPALALAARPQTPEPTETRPSLTGIAIYRRNIARLCKDREQFEHELRHAVLDELSMFLQLDDEARTALGLPPLAPPAPAVPEVEEPEEKPRRRRKRTRMHS